MMRRSTGMVVRAVLIISMVMVGVPAVARQNVSVELFYNGVWNNHTQDLYSRDAIHINHAILDGQTGLAPSDATLTWKNRDGKMNPDNRLSPLYGLIGHNTPIRIKVGSDIRFSGQVVSWKPRRTQGNTRFDAWVEAKAQSTLRRLGQGDAVPLRSALFRSIAGVANSTFAPHEYLPMEDGSQSTVIASGLAGRPAVTPSGPVTFAAAGPLGSAPVLRAQDGFQAAMPVSAYTDLGRWAVSAAVNVPAEPAATVTLLEVPVTGAVIASWRLQIQPGSPAEIRWQGYDSSGSPVSGWLASRQFGVGFNPTEADFFGRWWMITAGSEQSGSDVLAWLGFSDGTTSNSGPSVQMGNIVVSSATHHPVAGSVAAKAQGADPAGIGMGHLALFVSSSFNFLTWGFTNTRALSGWAGEKAGPRFTRLCAEENIASTIVDAGKDTQPMGPQPLDTLLGLFGEIARTDAGFIFDTREQLGLTLRTGRSLNNQTASMTLNWNAGHIGGPLEPDIDDLGRINVVTVKRREGSEFIDSDTTGPLGTAAIDMYKARVNINPASDADLPQHAHYHLVLGTDPDPRYSQVVVDLDANPTLTTAASAVNVGSLLALQGIPADLGQPAAELLALGYREMIGSHRRVIAFNARPGGILSHIGMLDGGAKACLQTAGAQLSSAITDVQASFPVFTSAGPLFTLTPPAGARIIVRDREIMPVTGIASALKDAFGRTVAVGWSTADSGQAWTASGTASVGGGFGQQSLTAGATVLCSAGVSLPDVDIVLGHTGISSAPAGDNVEVGARLRVSGTSYVQVRTFRLPSGAVTINVNEVVGGLEAGSSGFPTVPDVVATDSIAIRLQAFGSALRARAWLVGGIEPLVWQVTLTATHLAAGDVTMRGMLGASWTGASPLTVFYDNIEIVNPQTFTATRDPGQRMAHPSGVLVRVHQALRLRL